jgi:hypothetical protein
MEISILLNKNLSCNKTILIIKEMLIMANVLCKTIVTGIIISIVWVLGIGEDLD